MRFPTPANPLREAVKAVEEGTARTAFPSVTALPLCLVMHLLLLLLLLSCHRGLQG